jgi:Domain of unknown function (DUF397)
VTLSSGGWRKSTLSRDDGCVEVALIDQFVAVRDSKNPEGPTLRFSSTEWEAFTGGVRNGEFDLPSGATNRQI